MSGSPGGLHAPRASVLAPPRIERLAMPRVQGQPPVAKRHSNQRRAEAEHLMLLRELQVADVQLQHRSEAHKWQADTLRDQLEEVRAQMKSGAQMAMGAAVAAADARAASATEATKLRDQVTKLRAQVAKLKSERDGTGEPLGGSSPAAANANSSGTDWPGSSTRSMASGGGAWGGYVSVAEAEEMVRKSLVLEQQRGLKKFSGLENEITRLTNLGNSLRTERNKAQRELATCKDANHELQAQLTASLEELERADADRAVGEKELADEYAEREREMRVELQAADSTVAEQRAIISTLIKTDDAPAEEGVAHASPRGGVSFSVDGGAGGDGLPLSVDVGDGAGDGGEMPLTPRRGGGGGAFDDMMETVKMMRTRQAELEASEARLVAERDELAASGASLQKKLSASQSNISYLKQQITTLKTSLFAMERNAKVSGYAVEDSGDKLGWGSKRGGGGIGEYEPAQEGSAQYERELDVAKRTVEAQRTQLRTQQAEHLKCARELRAVKGRVDGLKSACEAAMEARQHAEETLNVQKVAAQAMLQRLQSRSAECTALQRQLSTRAVELVHAREERVAIQAAMDATKECLANEVFSMERWIFGPARPAGAAAAAPTMPLTPGAGLSTPRGASRTSGAFSIAGGFGGAAQRGSAAGESAMSFVGGGGGGGGGSAPSTPRSTRGGRGGGGAERGSEFGGGAGTPGLNQEAFMAKELMQCRHELEASRRVTSEYAERTHAAEKVAEKAKASMKEVHVEHVELKRRHELVLAEVQVQRNRVAQLRCAQSSKRGRGSDAGDEDRSTRSLSPEAQRGEASGAMTMGDRPGWNNDVVVRHPPKWKQKSNEMIAEGTSVLVDMNASGRGGGSGGALGGGGSNDHLAHLREGHAPRLLAPGESTSEGGNEGGASDKQLNSLKSLLGLKDREKAAAERAADERQAQCDKLQALVAEADARRDEQAEAAASAASEAAALRRQLQAVRDKVETLHEERAASQQAMTTAMAEAQRETRCQEGVLAEELRALEDLVAKQYRLLHPPPREGEEGAPPVRRERGGGFASGTSASARRSVPTPVKR